MRFVVVVSPKPNVAGQKHSWQLTPLCTAWTGIAGISLRCLLDIISSHFQIEVSIIKDWNVVA